MLDEQISRKKTNTQGHLKSHISMPSLKLIHIHVLEVGIYFPYSRESSNVTTVYQSLAN